MSDQTQLLRRCGEGDIQSVGLLLQTYQARLFQLAYSVLLDESSAIRAVRSAFLAVIQNPGRIRTDETLAFWLEKQTIRTCEKILAARAVGRQFHVPGGKPKPVEVIPETGVQTGPHQDDYSIWSAFQTLNDNQRFALTLRYFNNYAIDQIEKLLRVGNSTTITRLGSGRNHLLQMMETAVNPPTPPGKPEGLTISHDQARFLLQVAADSTLPASRWVPLQQHLDHCEDCQVYRRNLQTLERSLQRVLNSHLAAPAHPVLTDAQEILQSLRSAARRKKTFVSIEKGIGTLALLGIGIALVYILLLSSSQAKNNAPAAVIAIETPSPQGPTLSPLLEVPFRTTILYESVKDGNSEIYILDPNGEAVNLTQNPAQDTSASWSPDGEWIAFLSNRTGKNEIWVMRVSGTQLYQMTSDPDIDWQGPITWSPDGKRLALVGNWSEDQGQAWVYLVSLDASNPPARLSLTRGASNPRWSPQGDWIAYQQMVGGRSMLYARRINSNNVTSLTSGSPRGLQGRTPFEVPLGAFDWTATGNGLVYIMNGPYQAPQNGQTSQAQLTPQPDAASRIQMAFFSSDGGLTRYARPFSVDPLTNGIVSASSSSGRIMVYLQSKSTQCSQNGLYSMSIVLREGQGSGSDSRTANPQTDPQQFVDTPAPLATAGICVAGPLSGSAWSPDGRWLIFQAVQGSDSQPAIYAMDVIKTESDLFRDKSAPVVTVRLTEPSGKDVSPQARPQRAMLGITPKPVAPQNSNGKNPKGSLPPLSSIGATGQIFFSSEQDSSTRIFSMNVDGSKQRELSSTQGSTLLLSVSRSGNGRIAFLAGQPQDSGAQGEPISPIQNSGDLFFMGGNGFNIQRITGTSYDPHPASPITYLSTLTWSPDGSKLAAVVSSQHSLYLGVYQVVPTTGTPNEYIPLEEQAYTAPIWNQDGRSVLLFSASRSQKKGGFTMLTVGVNANQSNPQTSITLLPELDGEDSILSAVVDNQSNQIAILTAKGPNNPKGARVSLYKTMLNGKEGKLAASFIQQPGTLTPRLQLIPRQAQVLISFDASVDSYYKTSIYLINLYGLTPVILFQSEDSMNQQVVSPDGKWLAYGNERGIWLFNLGGAGGPLKTSDEIVQTIDWAP